MIQPIPKLKKPAKNRGRTKWASFRKSYLKDHVLYTGSYRCETCGQSTDNPELDHIKLRSTNPELVYDESNIRLSCSSCHNRRHLNERGI